jgi:hypothetical protein
VEKATVYGIAQWKERLANGWHIGYSDSPWESTVDIATGYGIARWIERLATESTVYIATGYRIAHSI